MNEKRVSPRTVRCNWCFLINPGRGWIAERRRRATSPYENVICRRCVNFFFGGVVPATDMRGVRIRSIG
ncbi:hypothetical protein [Mesoterricola silvestris]|uniref:Uncharacterized protein n=1 Tax=Mesoterricola silvestris TaxID=2927979 RepID=A0AA48GK83_9BACT|nr:hypothetical protein [Mesoterricola silvestris]BDU72729.1 hypothetical protein METEAL_19030 [Mesoterricola silvestris]